MYYIQSTGIYPVFFLIWLILVAWGHYELIVYYRTAHGPKKNQTLYFFFGMLVGFSGGTTNFYPMFQIEMYPFGNFTILLYCLIVTYAILKYRLMDIRVAITRTGIFIAVYTLILGLPFALSVWSKGWLINTFGVNYWCMALLVLMAILATAGPFIYIFFQRKAEARLLKVQYEYQDALKQASSGLIQIRELDKLLEFIIRTITQYVRVKRVIIFLFDSASQTYVVKAGYGEFRLLPEQMNIKPDNPLISYLNKVREPITLDDLEVTAGQYMEKIAASICVPAFSQNKLIGFIFLGEKLSGEMYSREDVSLFNALSVQAALAIENAQAYTELSRAKDKLFEAEKLASIGRLAGGIAHEIKNPLSSIKTFTAYLDKKFEDKEFRQKFQRIVGSEVDRINHIVEQLTTYAFPKKTDLKIINLSEVIESTLLLLENEIIDGGIIVKKQCGHEKLDLAADARQLKQVFLNLFLNSIQAMRDNQKLPRELDISCQRRDDYIEVKVSDTGGGIPQEQIPLIFEPFFTTKETGSGLGLAIVRSIIEGHKGKIDVYSSLQQGTTFSLQLPLAQL